MSDPRHTDGLHRRRPASAASRSGGSRGLPALGKVSLLASAVVLGATITVVVLDKKPAPPPAVNGAPVSTEVTLESGLWRSRKTVKATPHAENTPLQLGTRFTAARNGEVAGIRFYKPASARGVHRGGLWNAGGKPLAKLTFTGESRSGWQQAMFSTPVPIVAGRVYTVSYHARDGGYVAAPGAFERPLKAGPLTGQAGVFAAGGTRVFPSRVHPKKVGYYVDVIFRHREWRRTHRPAATPSGTPGPGLTPTAPGRPTGEETLRPTRTPGTTVTPAPSETSTPTASATRSHTPEPSATRSPTPGPSTRTPTPSPGPTRQPSKEPTAAPPPAGGFPGASNTGVPAGTSLKPSGSVTVTKDGTVIDGLHVRGEINVAADNVTIRNTRLAAEPGQWGIIQRKGHSGLKVEDSEIFGNGKERTQFAILNQGGELTVRRADIHTISNGILTEQGLIEDSYLHDPKYFSGDHTDMIMCTSGPPSGEDLVIRGNTVINTLEQTGAIALFQDFGVVRNVTVQGNLLAGGGYSLYAGAGGKGTSSNIKVIDNVFSRDIWAKGGYNGPVAYWDKNGPGNVWKNNLWEDGKPVSAS